MTTPPASGSEPTTDNMERELKLRPNDPALLDRLAAVERLGPFTVARRRRELQRNSFFDSAGRGLNRARVGFRRRMVQGQSLATWSLKGEGKWLRGVATRTEVELQLDPATPPAVAVGALRQAADQRGAVELAELVGQALAVAGPLLAEPFLETLTDRTILDLEASDLGWRVELALDRVRLAGHAYAEFEIEAELKGGAEAALDAAREAVDALGPTSESNGSKLSRARAHVAACAGCA